MGLAEETAKRLREFADIKGGPSALAKIIAVSPQTLNDYLSGRRIPGNKMRERLRAAGCDIEWLMYGRTVQSIADQINIDSAPPVTAEDILILKYLKLRDINTVAKIKEIYTIYIDFLRMSSKHQK